MVDNDPKNPFGGDRTELTGERRESVLRALHRTVLICACSFAFFIVIHILHLYEMGVIWDRIGLIACIIALLYAAASFVHIMILKGKVGMKSEYRIVITALIFSAALFIVCVVAILFGCGIL